VSVDASNDTLSLLTAGDTAALSNILGSISGDTVTVGSTSDNITMTTGVTGLDVKGADAASIAVNGANDSLTTFGNLADTLTLTNASNLGLSGNLDTVNLGLGSSLSLSGSSGDTLNVGTTNDAITLLGGVTGALIGGADGTNAISVEASNDSLSLLTTGDTAALSNILGSISGDTVSVGSTSDNITMTTGVTGLDVNGADKVGIAVNGANDSLTTFGSLADTLTLTNASNLGLSGSVDTVNLGVGSSLSLSGGSLGTSSGDTLNVGATNDAITLLGGVSGASIGGIDSTNAISVSASGDSLSLLKSGDIASLSGVSGDTITASATGDTIDLNGSVTGLTVGGADSSTIKALGTDSLSATTASDTLDLLGSTALTLTSGGSGDQIDSTGSSNTISLGTGMAGANVMGGSTAFGLTLTGAGDSLTALSTDTITDDASNTTINVSNDSNGITLGAMNITGVTIDGSTDGNINETSGDSLTVTGSGDLLKFGQGTETAFLNDPGTADTLDQTSSFIPTEDIHATGSSFNFEGNGLDTFYIYGTGDKFTDLSGSNDTFKDDGTGNTFDAPLITVDMEASGSSGDDDTVKVVGNSDKLYLATDDSAYLSGYSDTIGVDSGDGNGSTDIAYLPDEGDDNLFDDQDIDVFGFAGQRSTVNAALSQSVSSIAQSDFAMGNVAAGNAVQAGFKQAVAAASVAPSAGTGNAVLEGAKWDQTVITWSLADSQGPAGSPFSGYMDSSYEATVQGAFSAWAAADPGITFQEVADSSQSDIRLGFGDFDSATSAVVGLTSLDAVNGVLQPDAVIRVEDPTELALTADATGQQVYTGTDATLSQVLLHEIGHSLGLADNSDQNSVMYYELTANNRSLDSTDLAGIASVYATAANAAVGNTGVNQLIQAMSTFDAGSASAADTSLSLATTQSNPLVVAATLQTH
jgi:hypothetical protein